MRLLPPALLVVALAGCSASPAKSPDAAPVVSAAASSPTPSPSPSLPPWTGDPSGKQACDRAVAATDGGTFIDPDVAAPIGALAVKSSMRNIALAGQAVVDQVAAYRRSKTTAGKIRVGTTVIELATACGYAGYRSKP